ncbi:hypothetical protein Hroenn_gp49 [Pelagibacter phage Hroenn EXVC015P]|nr:hypothetical protein Bylgja_gp15 [Pelagibacter phage Bylgja EXVC010P]QLF88311.1 hypothetical protein Himinglaeva_gp15 [Pelagibacter phage Himinglaeva EXVC011P]QLF88394.1 hypothetical protein Hroenn_gp49 [Pelagibacter phage Hroenn EXVC015P]QLF88609.1 hypothetical protein Unn_gp51 [Pelagibacter phage Unn EXVC019P]
MTNARDKANIPVLNFQSKGIDDNADATAITINSSEQVGIGTASPGYPLQINSSAQTTLLHLNSTAGTSSAISFANTGSNDSIAISAESDNLKLRTDDGNILFAVAENSEKVRISSAGRLGINDSSPDCMLNIGANSGLSNGDRMRIEDGTYKLDLGVGATSFIGTIGASAIKFSTNSSERMRILSDGKIGIGTSSPSTPLEIASSDQNLLYLNSSHATNAKIKLQGGYHSNLFSEIVESAGSFSIDVDANNQEANSHFRVKVKGTERIRIKSDGKVGIGTSSPSTSLHISSASPQISLTETDQSNKQYRIGSFGGAYAVYDVSATQYRHIIDTNGNHIFNEGSQDCDFRVESNNISDMFVVDGGADRVYINSGSNVSSEYFLIRNNYTRTGMTIKSNTANAHHAIEFHNTNNQVGSINTSGSSVVYNTSSDYRLKENVSYNFDATTRLKQLKPARFNFIADADTTVDGFLAHEVSSVVPEAISGEKDAVDDDGNPKYQGIDQSKLVPLLVKTIQELEARITTLEANNP